MRHRWSMLLGLAENSWGGGALASPDGVGLRSPTTRTATSGLLTRLLGYAPSAAVAAIVAGSGWPADQPLNANGAADASRRWARLAAYCAMAPEFQIS
jgi:hypothetical protein